MKRTFLFLIFWTFYSFAFGQTHSPVHSGFAYYSKGSSKGIEVYNDCGGIILCDTWVWVIDLSSGAGIKTALLGAGEDGIREHSSLESLFNNFIQNDPKAKLAINGSVFDCYDGLGICNINQDHVCDTELTNIEWPIKDGELIIKGSKYFRTFDGNVEDESGEVSDSYWKALRVYDDYATIKNLNLEVNEVENSLINDNSNSIIVGKNFGVGGPFTPIDGLTLIGLTNPNDEGYEKLVVYASNSSNQTRIDAAFILGSFGVPLTICELDSECTDMTQIIQLDGGCSTQASIVRKYDECSNLVNSNVIQSFRRIPHAIGFYGVPILFNDGLDLNGGKPSLPSSRMTVRFELEGGPLYNVTDLIQLEEVQIKNSDGDFKDVLVYVQPHPGHYEGEKYYCYQTNLDFLRRSENINRYFFEIDVSNHSFSNGFTDFKFKVSNGTYTSIGKGEIYFVDGENFADIYTYPDKSEREYMIECIDKGILRGSGTSFLTYEELTYVQAAKILFNIGKSTVPLFGLDTSPGNANNPLSKCHPEWSYVQTLINRGLDISDFDPDNGIPFNILCKYLVELFGLTSNNTGTNDQSTNDEATSDPNVNIIRNILVKKLKGNSTVAERLDDVFYLNENGDPSHSMYTPKVRARVARVLSGVFDHLKEKYNGSSSLLPNQSYSDWNLIGGKLNLEGGADETPPPLLTGTRNIFDNETLELDLPLQDNSGNPLAFYWAVKGGDLQPTTTGQFNAVTFTPPTVNSTTTFDLYIWVGNTEGEYAEGILTIIVTPEGENPTTSDMTLTATISPNTAFANDPVSLSGTLAYDTGAPVVNGTVTIDVDGSTCTTPTDANGAFQKVIPAPANSTTVQVTGSDGNLSDTVDLGLTITTQSTDYSIMNNQVTTAVNQVPLNNKIHIRSTENRVFHWFEVVNVNDNLTVQWNFIDPNGDVWLTEEGLLVDSNGGGYAAWAYMDVGGTGAEDLEGRWSVQVSISENGGAFEQVITDYFYMVYEFNSHVMCEDINEETNQYVNPTNTFYTNDDRAYTWAKFTNIAEQMDVKTEWYDPNDELMFDYEFTITDPIEEDADFYPDFYQWNWLDIVGNPAAYRTGTWTVKYFEKDVENMWDLIYQDNFQILEDPNVDPVPSVSINNNDPTEADPINITFSATDNTYLNKVTCYWRIDNGAWQSEVQNSINAFSWSGTKDLGLFTEGTRIEFYATAIDNSGNMASSPTQVIIVKDDDTIPPSISNQLAVEYNGNNDGLIQDTEQILLSAIVTDNKGVGEVIFYIDGNVVPLTGNYTAIAGPLSSGVHTFTVVATDSDNSPLSIANSITFEVCTLLTYYQDVDGDSYGNPNVMQQSCTPITGYVTNDGDCNDNDPFINPSALEACDEIDNNCNGIIDDAVIDCQCLIVTNTNNAGDGSLREAINCANINPVPDVIKFDLSGNEPHTITVNSPLPALTDDGTTIDGTTQPGHTTWWGIIIDGNNTVDRGIEINANDCALYGLQIQHFQNGIYVDGNHAIIGEPFKRNFILSNALNGILLENADHTTIQSSYIGTRVLEERDANLGNGIAGINAINSNHLTIGGTENRQGNTIANNQYAIRLEGGGNNRMAENQLFCNTNAIVFSSNNLVNSGKIPPVISSVSNTNISGTAEANDYIEVFLQLYTEDCISADCQGKEFLGATTTNASGTWNLSGPFDHYVDSDASIVATATDADNNTSMYSDCLGNSPTVCNPPVPTSPTIISGNVVKLNWYAATDADRYRIRFRPIAGTWVEKLTAADETFRFLNELSPNTTYEYQLKTLCLNLNSTWTSTSTFTTNADICDLPAQTSSNILNATDVALSWTAYPDNIKYKLKIKPSNNTSPWTEYNSLNTNTKTETGLFSGMEYKYKLKTKCVGGWTGWSSNYYFMMPSSRQDGNVEESNPSFQLFPNPAKDQVKLTFTNDTPKTIQLLDIHGKLLEEFKTAQSQMEFSVAALPSGIYYINVLSAEQTKQNARFVKL